MLSLVRVSVMVYADRCCLCFCCPCPPVLPPIFTFSVELAMVVVVFFASFIAVPERNDINPGSIGRIHGEKKEAKPAPAETRTLVSIVNLAHTNFLQQPINTYFQIMSKLRFSEQETSSPWMLYEHENKLQVPNAQANNMNR
jgi:hypothetical protein